MSTCLDVLRKAPTDSHQPRVSQKIELTAGLSVRERAQARSLSEQKLDARRLGGASERDMYAPPFSRRRGFRRSSYHNRLYNINNEQYFEFDTRKLNLCSSRYDRSSHAHTHGR